jgi:glutamate synthase (NADPH/NADH) small chain
MNSKAGGRIWEFEEFLTAELINDELNFLNDDKITLIFDTFVDEEKLNAIIDKYDAVFITAKNLMHLFQIDSETFQAGESKVFAGKINSENEN